MPRQRQSRPLSPAHAALGEAIVELRRRADLTQEGLAERSELHMTQVGGMERGVANPSYSTLLKLAAGFGVSVGQLTTLAGELQGRAGRPLSGERG
jgi:transcriptional regulator with XRE-family HTH domain